MAEEATLEQALAVLDTYNRQLEALGRQLGFLQALLNETTRARLTLEGLRKEADVGVLVPLGANTYVYGDVKRRDRALVGVGASVSVEKTWTDAEARLAEREKEIQDELQRLSEAITRLQQEAATLEADIQDDVDRARSAALPSPGGVATGAPAAKPKKAGTLR